MTIDEMLDKYQSYQEELYDIWEKWEKNPNECDNPDFHDWPEYIFICYLNPADAMMFHVNTTSKILEFSWPGNKFFDRALNRFNDNNQRLQFLKWIKAYLNNDDVFDDYANAHAEKAENTSRNYSRFFFDDDKKDDDNLGSRYFQIMAYYRNEAQNLHKKAMQSVCNAIDYYQSLTPRQETATPESETSINTLDVIDDFFQKQKTGKEKGKFLWPGNKSLFCYAINEIRNENELIKADTTNSKIVELIGDYITFKRDKRINSKTFDSAMRYATTEYTPKPDEAPKAINAVKSLLSYLLSDKPD